MEPINFRREMMRDRLTKAGRVCEVIPEPTEPIERASKGWTEGTVYIYPREGNFRTGKPNRGVVLGVKDGEWVLEWPIEQVHWEVMTGAEIVAGLERMLAMTSAERARRVRTDG